MIHRYIPKYRVSFDLNELAQVLDSTRYLEDIFFKKMNQSPEGLMTNFGIIDQVNNKRISNKEVVHEIFNCLKVKKIDKYRWQVKSSHDYLYQVNIEFSTLKDYILRFKNPRMDREVYLRVAKKKILKKKDSSVKSDKLQLTCYPVQDKLSKKTFERDFGLTGEIDFFEASS